MTAPKAEPTRHECISKRGNSWLVRVRLGEGKPYTRSWPTLQEAIDDRDRVRGNTLAGQTVVTAKMAKVTVGEVAAAFLEAGSATWGYNTRRRHASEWRALEPHFGHRRVTTLVASDVADWYAGELRRSMASTARQKRRLLVDILDRAARDYDLTNPARSAKVQRAKRGRGPQVEKGYTFTPEEMARVLEEAAPRYLLAFQLMLGLGLRSGEARGLTLDRVDFSTGKVKVDRQMVKVTAGEEPEEVDLITPTMGLSDYLKSDASYGTLKAGTLLAAIHAHVEVYGTGPHGLLLTSKSGGPLPDTTWTSEVRRVAMTTGVDFTGHDLRHTFGSWMLAQGHSVAQVAKAMRHDVLTCTRTYLHAEEEATSTASDGVLARVSAASAARKPRARGHLRAVG